jgi:hypothetical protein
MPPLQKLNQTKNKREGYDTEALCESLYHRSARNMFRAARVKMYTRASGKGGIDRTLEVDARERLENFIDWK